MGDVERIESHAMEHRASCGWYDFDNDAICRAFVLEIFPCDARVGIKLITDGFEGMD